MAQARPDIPPNPTSEIKEEKHKTSLSQILTRYAGAERGPEFDALIQAHLKKHYSEKPFQMLLWTWNHPWGIGDVVHNRDFFTHFSQISGLEHINVKSICIVSYDKQEKALLMLQDTVAEEDIYKFDDHNREWKSFNLEQAQKSKYIIWKGFMLTANSVDKGSLAGAKNKDKLIKFLQQYDCIANISRSSLTEPDLKFMFEAVKKSSYKQSMAEYGHYPTFLFDKTKENYVFDSQSMGLDSSTQQIGIKFSQRIKTFSERTRSDSDKAHFLLKENPNFIHFLLGDIKDEEMKAKAAESFFKENSIAFGYMQDQAYLDSGTIREQDYFERFLLSAVGQLQKPNLVFFTNSTLKSKRMYELLIKAGVGTIKIAGTPPETIVLSEAPPHQKQITIINYTGMSDSDKDKLIALSDVIGASGDTSYSEVFSAGISKGILPFFQIRHWKLSFFAGMVQDIKKNCPDLSVLAKYITILASFEAKYQQYYLESGPSFNMKELEECKKNEEQFFDFIKQNHVILTEEFQKYSEFAYLKHNVEFAQNNMLVRALISSVLSKGSDVEIEQLLIIFPNYSIPPHNFVLMAAEQDNPKVLIQLFKHNKKQFIELLQKNFFADSAPPVKLDISPLKFLIAHNHANSLQALIQEPELSALFNLNSLKLAIKNKAQEAAAAIIEAIPRKDLTSQDEQKNTVFLTALHEGAWDIAKKLLEKKADPNMLDSTGKAPLLIATESKQKEGIDETFVDFLLLSKADINTKGYLDRTALQNAIRTKNVKLVEVLLKYHPTLEPKNPESIKLLTDAVDGRNGPIVKLLLDYQPNFSSSELGLLLHEAVQRDEEIVKILIEHKANVNEKNEAGKSPLHSVWYGSIAICLLQNKADVNLLDSNNQTPLQTAISECVPATVVEQLLKFKATFDLTAPKSMDSLSKAIKNSWGISQLFQILLYYQADSFENFDFGILLDQVKHNKEKIINLLISEGAIVSILADKKEAPHEHKSAEAPLVILPLQISQEHINWLQQQLEKLMTILNDNTQATEAATKLKSKIESILEKKDIPDITKFFRAIKEIRKELTSENLTKLTPEGKYPDSLFKPATTGSEAYYYGLYNLVKYVSEAISPHPFILPETSQKEIDTFIFHDKFSGHLFKPRE